MSDSIFTVDAERRDKSNHWSTDEVLSLISYVQESSCIYNPQSKNYSCRPIVENLWREIDIKLGKNVGTSLIKWTNLRITFRKEFKNFLKFKEKPTWKYFEKMYFLHKYLRWKSDRPGVQDTSMNETLSSVNSIISNNVYTKVETLDECFVESVSQDEDYKKSWNENDNTVETNEIYDSDEFSKELNRQVISPNEIVIDKTTPRNHPEVENYSGDEEEDKISYQNHTESTREVTVERCLCTSDPNAMFLMSLLPDVKSLSRRDRGVFKIEVQKLLHNLLFPDSNS